METWRIVTIVLVSVIGLLLILWVWTPYWRKYGFRSREPDRVNEVEMTEITSDFDEYDSSDSEREILL